MLHDFCTYPNGAAIDTDLCIIGAGIAGITLAREFIGKAIDVCLLESGGTDFEESTQSLYEGENLGMAYYDLDEARLRFFGGTTAVWGGRCVPLDPIDFERRDWVPNSGWPISKAELDPYYARAHRALELGPNVYDERAWKLLGIRPPAFDPSKVRTDFWQFDRAYARFGFQNCRDLTNARNVGILLHANVTNIQTDPTGATVDHVDIATLEGKTGRVRAKAYVLAVGGIENARLLLVSNGVDTRGLGNRHDLVGRFFMEHAHGRGGQVLTPAPYRLSTIYAKRYSPQGDQFAPVLRPGEELQKRAGILNTAAALKYQRRPESGLSMSKAMYRSIKSRTNPTARGRRLWRLYKLASALRHRLSDPVMRRLKLASGRGGLYLVVRAEQAPNPDSRVVLSDKRDALGVRRADLNWRMSELDKRTVAVLVEALDQEFQRLNLGRVRTAGWLLDGTTEWPVDPTVSNHPIGGYHHIGTTRMANDPQQGVVDANGRVHGTDNLYVAGSSVFPTSGWANPAMTIMALALRQADHLQAKLI
jgi:choline dehydrogenase-like flavoprotein